MTEHEHQWHGYSDRFKRCYHCKQIAPRTELDIAEHKKAMRYSELDMIMLELDPERWGRMGETGEATHEDELDLLIHDYPPEDVGAAKERVKRRTKKSKREASWDIIHDLCERMASLEYRLQQHEGQTGSSSLGNLRGLWNPAEQYNQNDAVLYYGSVYISSGDNDPNVPPTNDDGATTTRGWHLFAAEGARGKPGAVGPAGLTWRGKWNSDTEYLGDDAVQHGGHSYFATQEPPVGSPPSFDSDYWAPLCLVGVLEQ